MSWRTFFIVIFLLEGLTIFGVLYFVGYFDRLEETSSEFKPTNKIEAESNIEEKGADLSEPIKDKSNGKRQPESEEKIIPKDMKEYIQIVDKERDEKKKLQEKVEKLKEEMEKLQVEVERQKKIIEGSEQIKKIREEVELKKKNQEKRENRTSTEEEKKKEEQRKIEENKKKEERRRAEEKKEEERRRAEKLKKWKEKDEDLFKIDPDPLAQQLRQKHSVKHFGVNL